MDNKAVSHEWMKKAEHDLGTAKLVVDAGIPYADQVCFHAQQAAEKALKSILAFFGSSIPKTHDLMFLLDAVRDTTTVPVEFDAMLELLDGYSVDVRYPMGDFDPKDDDAREALRCAGEFWRFACTRIDFQC
jgi:HEPN domain-containing protein